MPESGRSHAIGASSQAMKYRFLNRFTPREMLDHDALEELGRHPRVPDAFRINHDDWAIATHPEAGSLSALHPFRAKQQPFALQQLSQQRVQRASAPVR